MATSEMRASIQPVSRQLAANQILRYISLLVILACAIYLRFVGLDYGLPLVYGDENPIVEHALSISLSDLNPHMFTYASLPFYIFKLISVVSNLIGPALTGQALTFPDHILVLRYFAAAASVLTVYLVFLFSKLLFDARIGLFSAALFTFSPLAIDLGHTTTVDALLGVWSVTALVGMALWLQNQPHGFYLASVATGLAVATKYNAAIFLVAIFVIALLEARERDRRRLDRPRIIAFATLVVLSLLVYVGIVANRDNILAFVAAWSTRGQLEPAYIAIFDRLLKLGFAVVIAGVALAVGVIRGWRWPTIAVGTLLGARFLRSLAIIGLIFVCTSPFVLLDFPTFAREFFFQMRHVASPGTVAYDLGSRSYQAAAQSASTFQFGQYIWAVRDEWGVVVFLAMVAGFWAGWRSLRSKFLPFALLCGLIFVATIGWSYLAIRYLYPLWAIFTTLAAAGIVVSSTQLARGIRSRSLAMLLAVALIVLALMQPITASLASLRSSFLVPDTRTTALSWIQTHLPAGTIVLRELGTPNLELISPRYQVFATDTAFEEAPLQEWQRRGVTVIMLSDRRYEFYQQHSAAFEDVLRDYETIKNDWTLAASYRPGPDMNGMAVYIYVAPKQK